MDEKELMPIYISSIDQYTSNSGTIKKAMMALYEKNSDLYGGSVANDGPLESNVETVALFHSYAILKLISTSEYRVKNGPVVLYRGDGFKTDDIFADFIQNKRFYRILSTTKDEKEAVKFSQNVVFEINIDEGCLSVDVSTIDPSKYQSEQEVMLPDGILNNIKITLISRNSKVNSIELQHDNALITFSMLRKFRSDPSDINNLKLEHLDSTHSLKDFSSGTMNAYIKISGVFQPNIDETVEAIQKRIGEKYSSLEDIYATTKSSLPINKLNEQLYNEIFQNMLMSNSQALINN